MFLSEIRHLSSQNNTYSSTFTHASISLYNVFLYIHNSDRRKTSPCFSSSPLIFFLLPFLFLRKHKLCLRPLTLWPGQTLSTSVYRPNKEGRVEKQTLLRILDSSEGQGACWQVEWKEATVEDLTKKLSVCAKCSASCFRCLSAHSEISLFKWCLCIFVQLEWSKSDFKFQNYALKQCILLYK